MGGKYLSSKKSWNEEYYQLAKQEEQLGLTKGWYGDKNIWKTYNEFFSRKLKDKYQRPIGNADVISPADSEPKGFYKIDQNNKLIDKTVNLKSARLNSIEPHWQRQQILHLIQRRNSHPHLSKYL